MRKPESEKFREIVPGCSSRRVPIPKTRDPFVNTPLLSLGPDAQGRERFWISTWNSEEGTICVLVNEVGDYQIFRPGPPHSGFYSAAQEDADTLWLCGSLDRVVRFSISTGEFRCFDTGAPPALVFQGMVFDPGTKKLFAVAFSPPRTTAFSFDTSTGKTCRIYNEFKDFSSDHSMRYSFPNGDGTWSVILHTPGESIVRWDPKQEKIKVKKLSDKINFFGVVPVRTYSIVGGADGRRYFPNMGWLNPLTYRFQPGPKPEKELTWFSRRGSEVYGGEMRGGDCCVTSWNLGTGKVRNICEIPDSHIHNLNTTTSGKIVCVNRYGVFYRFDAATGSLEMSRALPTDAIGRIDCLCRIDNNRLLGTTFITQRFWIADIKTGRGADCGRAAPGGGEVLKLWKIAGKIYMAAYTGGELTEFNPGKGIRFPENPRVVAKPPHGMRPVAAAEDGRNLFYACSAPYGFLGSVLTRYDTQTGIASYSSDPLPEQQIRSIFYLKEMDELFCGTTMHSDCQSCPPSAGRCYLARLSAVPMQVLEKVAAPAGVQEARVVGKIAKNKWLCVFDTKWAVINPHALTIPEDSEMHELPDGFKAIQWAGRAGLFLLYSLDRIELWDMRKPTRVKTLLNGINCTSFIHLVVAQDRSVYAATNKEVIIFEDVI